MYGVRPVYEEVSFLHYSAQQADDVAPILLGIQFADTGAGFPFPLCLANPAT